MMERFRSGEEERTKVRDGAVVLCLLLAGMLLHCRSSPERLSHLLTFEMEDQFQKVHSDEDFKGRVLVIVGSDKDGAAWAKEWGKALAVSLQPEKDRQKISLIGLSDLRGVPFFLKRYVRGKFPQEKEEWALLDWQGLFSATYSFVPGEANVLVFECGGSLVHQDHFSDCDPADVITITALVRKTIKACAVSTLCAIGAPEGNT
jgi:hypothetical protein